MRILIVHNSLNDSTSISGVFKHYALISEEWNRKGHSTDFVAAKAGWPQLRELAPHAGRISSDGIFNATRYLSKTWLYFPAFAYRMMTVHWIRLPKSYDVVYASGQFIVEIYGAMVLARRLGAKLCVKIHHVLAGQPRRLGFFDKLFLRAERQSTRWINRYFHLIITSIGPVAQDYRKLESTLDLPPRRVYELGYGTDLDALVELKSPNKEFDAVLLGRLHEQKGIFDLPLVWREVVATLPKAKLLVIGEGPHRKQLDQLFKQMGLEAAVLFTGGIGEHSKNAFLSQAKIGISLSFEEGWGLSVTEFLAAGLPVIAYALPVFSQIFPDQLEVVPSGDWKEFSRRLVDLLLSDEKRKQRAEQGRRFVQRYDYKIVAKQELDLMEKCIQNRLD